MTTTAIAAILEAGIPLTGFMGVTVQHYDGRELRLTAPYEPNRNHKGAAFGGSLAALAVVTGWSMIELARRERGLDAEVVISQLETRYLAPVTTTLVSHCERPPTAAMEALFAEFMTCGKATIELAITIEGERANSVMSRGRYVLIRRSTKRED
ncbi:MAG TPA: YiiD C-terminal domain-containing protein [Candidatus Acidoferrales bacterium]|nr:YiiD C-terminal domain-containing protein [Candidatus Acidoferrales bacterium]